MTPHSAADGATSAEAGPRLPAVLRTSSFRLSLQFLTLFAAAAAAFLVYIYVATAGEVTGQADAEVGRELRALQNVYSRGGIGALDQALIERAAGERPYLYLLMRRDGSVLTGNLAQSPVRPRAAEAHAAFRVRKTEPDGSHVSRAAWGRQVRLTGGELLFVGADVGESQAFVMRITRAAWGAGVLVVLLGLGGGVLVSRNVARRMNGLSRAVAAVQAGDLRARAPVRGVSDEFDALAVGLNSMLDRVERLMSDQRHAGDAIAHDLRSPLTRLRARLEAGLLAAESGRADPLATLAAALEDTDGVLRTFAAVLAIARLQAAGRTLGAVVDLTALVQAVAELYEPLCEDSGLAFTAELASGLSVRGDREFVAQALSNLLDNAVKYTPAGGAVTLRARRRASGEVEVSVTDTGPGVPAADRSRVLERFVRLDRSRSAPGAGLGLSLVAAVAEAHGARFELEEGPGVVERSAPGHGPGLRTALSFPSS